MKNRFNPEVVRKWFEVGANAPTNRLLEQPITGVEFYLNHAVLVTRGDHQGKRVSIIALESLEPEPQFRAELPNGKDIIVKQSDLEADDETWKIAEQLSSGDSSLAPRIRNA